MTSVNLQIEESIARVRFVSENGIQLLTQDVRRQLGEIVTQIENDTAVSIVVFEATGRTFIAGADITELRQLTKDTAYESSRAGQRLMNRIEQLAATTVVAIHAACAGGGCELALACDLRIAAESAVIGLPETRIGVIPGWGGTVRAVEALGNQAARRLILSGELLSSDKALAIGLIHDVAPDDEFRDAVELLVESLLGRGPKARMRAKRIIQQFSGGSNDKRFETEARKFASCFESDEPVEGMNAFLEKRSPNW